jgi:hypothetical protein
MRLLFAAAAVATATAFAMLVLVRSSAIPKGHAPFVALRPSVKHS